MYFERRLLLSFFLFWPTKLYNMVRNYFDLSCALSRTVPLPTSCSPIPFPHHVQSKFTRGSVATEYEPRDGAELCGFAVLNFDILDFLC